MSLIHDRGRTEGWHVESMRIRRSRSGQVAESAFRSLPAMLLVVPLLQSDARLHRAAGFALLAIALGLGWRGGAVELTPTHLVELGPRHRSIEWSRIQDIVISRRRGVSSVHIISDDGANRMLGAPRAVLWSDSGRRFGADYERLGQWWMDHRGADWHPGPLNPWTRAEDRLGPPIDNPWISGRRA